MKPTFGNDGEPTEKASSSKELTPESPSPLPPILAKVAGIQNPFQPPPPVVVPPPGADPASAGSAAEDPTSEPESPFAWQPFTFGGVALFSTATMGRVLLVQLIVAMIVGATAVWFVDGRYSPVIIEAIQNLPEEAQMWRGSLEGVESGLLAENKFLSLAIDLEPSGDMGQTADFQFEFRKNSIQACSMFRSVAGVLEVDYPGNASFLMSRSALEPWWGAWHPMFYVGIVLLVAVALLSLWFLLAWVYAIPAKLIAYYADRELSMWGAWRLASAALMPGAFIMTLGIVFYGWQVLDLIGLAALVGLHLVVGWIYILVSPCRIQQLAPDALKSNPFTPAPES